MGNIVEDFTYNEPPTTPHTLTDERARYAAPSEAALKAVEDLIWCGIDGGLGELVIGYNTLSVCYDTLEQAEEAQNKLRHSFAQIVDQFAAQQVEAALNHAQYIHISESDDKADKAVAAREAQIITTLEHQAEVWERMKDMTPSAELRANVYRTAINCISKM